jgi:CBS domain-containing protein
VPSSSDVVRFVDRAADPTDTTVGQFMRTDVVTTTPDATVATVAATMVDRRIHHVPVVDRDDDPVGMFSTMDVTATVADH